MENIVTLEVLGIEVSCNLISYEHGFGAMISSELARKCYKKALQYIVFGDIPESMRVGVEQSGECFDINVRRQVELSTGTKVYWLGVRFDNTGEGTVSLSLELSDYLAVSVKQGIPFSLFSIQG